MPGVPVRGQKLLALHAATCYPDYWGGHHLPHVAVSVHNGMTLKLLKQALNSELHQGCIMGAEAPAENDDKWFREAKFAVDAIAANDPDPSGDDLVIFSGMEEDHDDVYAYFVFKEAA